MIDASPLRKKLAASIASPGWTAALEAVPRELFVGDALFQYQDAGGWTPVSRSEMPEEEWLALVYTDETWVTQVDGVMARDAAGPMGIRRPTSSSTLPSLVVQMLDVAGIGEGGSVLEIGTGTGYSTALMCHRLGEQAVTSVETDPEVAGRASAALEAAGFAPTLVLGDGLAGYPARALYDRLIATCAVRTIPPAWLTQVRTGGTITAPMLGWAEGAAFAHLTVTDAGEARGRFVNDDVYFMPARPHAAPPRGDMYIGRGEARPTDLNPKIVKDSAALFTVQLAIPGAILGWLDSTLTLRDPRTGAQADISDAPGGGWIVHQDGPVRLWDAVEKVIELWRGAGSPHQSGFGLTATLERQWVWLGEPNGPSWTLPAHPQP
ncbi:ATP-grasp peptide maturase system methyltransferase [Nonomuraea sp. NPDC059023]|uniref:ATP-grasp peptide maturase system methyltransferase n=1 Tax=unclassified Nonomuraea TaxID=2593643 RepID=UPI0036982FCE